MSVTERDASDADAKRLATRGDLRHEVDSLARPVVEAGETPGMVVGVLLPGGRMQFFAYGVADPQSGRRPDADTLFAVGSVSKSFLAAIADSLVAEGMVSWEDTLGELLPRERLSPDAARITLRQLATHTSGLPRQPATLETLGYFLNYLFTGDNLYRHLDRKAILAYLAEFEAPHGRHPQYSNLGYAVLALVLEARTGKALDTLLDEKVVRPLGLHNTGYAPESLPGFATRARGHAGDQPKFIARGTPLPDWRFGDPMKGSGGVHSSARDLLIHAAALLREGSAWGMDRDSDARIAWQAGVVAGYSSFLGLDLENRTAVVVLQNSFNWTDKVGHRVLLRLRRAQEMRAASVK